MERSDKAKDAEKQRIVSYTTLRSDLLELIPGGNGAVLDVGCSNGALGKVLKQRNPNRIIYGIEKEPEFAGQAEKVLDRIFVGDVESVEISGQYEGIIYGDVLEHLQNPQKILLKHIEHLDPGGWVVVSVPNVRHISVIWNLLKGDWPLNSRGIFDRSHLRWFTRKSLYRMLRECGLEPQCLHRNYRIIERPHKFNKVSPYIAALFFPFKDFITFQFLVRAVKVGE